MSSKLSAIVVAADMPTDPGPFHIPTTFHVHIASCEGIAFIFEVVYNQCLKQRQDSSGNHYARIVKSKCISGFSIFLIIESEQR